jgi:replicative DNA helicase
MAERSDRIPPHSLEAERAVLGGIMLQNGVLDTVLEIAKVEDFYSEGNGRIFEAMMELHRSSTPIDTITLREHLAKANKLQSVGGDEYLLNLTDTIPTLENIKSHATIIRDKALVRRMITACHGVSAKGYGDYGETQEFLDLAEKAVFDVANVQTRTTVVPISQIVLQAFQQISEMARAGKRIAGLSTGFTRLDQMTAGMHPGDLIIVAGRPGMGKTSFALNVGINACHASATGPDKKRAAVAVFSLEMPKDQLVKRMLCSEARVDASRMRTGQLSREDWPQLAQAAGMLSDLPVFIDDTPGLTLMELRAKSRRIASEHGLGLIIIDYLQLMRAGIKTDSREQEISEISRSLKGMAKELGIPVMALSQLNRGVESRGNKDKRPQLSDLRESGAIEQDADTIWFVYRDEVYNKESLDQGVAEIIIGKQRAGPTGTTKVRFFNQYTRFDNLADEDQGGEDAGYG